MISPRFGETGTEDDLVCMAGGHVLKSFIMPYKTVTQTSGPEPHFTAVENAAQRGRVTQPRFIASPHQNGFWDALSLSLKINLAPLAPELSVEPQLTVVLNFLSLSPPTCIYSLFFSVLDVAGCKAEHIALFASALCW